MMSNFRPGTETVWLRIPSDQAMVCPDEMLSWSIG
jgi:hypothetical protein